MMGWSGEVQKSECRAHNTVEKRMHLHMWQASGKPTHHLLGLILVQVAAAVLVEPMSGRGGEGKVRGAGGEEGQFQRYRA